MWASRGSRARTCMDIKFGTTNRGKHCRTGQASLSSCCATQQISMFAFFSSFDDRMSATDVAYGIVSREPYCSCSADVTTGMHWQG